MKIFWDLFFSFFKIGAFTIGGGYAMVPLIQKEVVENQGWIKEEEFLNMLALAQSSPGPIAVNTSVFVGYKVNGIKGALISALGAILPSFLIILILAAFMGRVQDNPYVIKAFKGIRPAVVALIVVSVFTLGKKLDHHWYLYGIVIGVAVLVAYIRISPVWILLVAAAGGNLIGMWRER